MEPIRYFNRLTGQMETETVYGEAFLRWIYQSSHGQLALHALAKRAIFSKWYGWRMNRPASQAKIEPFLAEYGLDPAEFAEPLTAFANFNEFFFRKLKPQARPIDTDPDHVVFPADGRHLGFAKASAIDSFFVKGQRFDLEKLLDSRDLAQRFADGALILSRLCPVDYHRFHFPASGAPGQAREIAGPLFSVSPIALRKRLDYLWENKRVVTELETERFGTVLIIEIGATCVGSIHQTYQPGVAVQQGDEKGYFAFGGSSTITVFEPGRVELAADLLEHSAQQTELYARIGTYLGKAG